MRNYSIDTMRFVACFFIIAVHIGGYPQQGELFTEVFRGVSRWAVPFFFLVTGYFLSCQNKRKLLLRLTRITYITLIFSVLFFIFQLTLNYKD
ncbi:acyltransferase family protein, partial [Escherichia coli]|nr:acyltransferase family protein [Escherichia coli]